ncbi:MAG: hypothetical protein NVS4B8_07800 [Herpetosiphon sp.]
MERSATLGTLILQLLPIVVFFVAGIALRRQLLAEWQGNVRRLGEFQRGLNMLLMNVLLPAVAFLSMARLPLDVGWRLVWVPVVGLAVALVALAINHLLLAWPGVRPKDERQRRALNMMAPWSNTVIVGLPTVATLLGPNQLYVPFLESSFVWTLILGPLIIHGTGDRNVLAASIRPLLKSIWFWAIPAGLLWGLLRLPITGPWQVLFERGREAFLALGLLTVGLGFDPQRLRPRHAAQLPLRAIGLGAIIKLLVCPLLALVLTWPLHLPPNVPAALALAVAAPSSLTAYIISEREGVDPEFMSFVFALYGTLFFATILFVRAVLLPLAAP